MTSPFPEYVDDLGVRDGGADGDVLVLLDTPVLGCPGCGPLRAAF
ncbi:hypothetical protein ACO0M4_06225 [Streptomyces sp. RGM 3693]